MKCPLCNLPMQQLNISGVTIDECFEGCHGLWFDALELKRLDEAKEGAGDDLERILSYPRKSDERSAKPDCPRCHISLQRKSYYYRSGIFIDECYNCGGVWLDQGELAAIRSNFKNNEEREQIAEQMILENPQFNEFVKVKSDLERQTELIRQKGLFHNLSNLFFFRK
jgi:uncharacterized protein